MAKTASVIDLCRNILIRMREIDRDISPSVYNGGNDTNDRPPNGDDYNLLWDAILDEIGVAHKDIADFLQRVLKE